MIKDELIQKLKETRESRGISLQDAARVLSIRVQVLQDLEEGRFERLGALLYIKSYVRKYSAFLKINPEEIEALLSQLEDPFKYEKSESVIRAQLNVEKRMVQRSFFRWYSIILAIVLGAGIFVYFVYGEKVVDIFHIRPTPDRIINYQETPNNTNVVVNEQVEEIDTDEPSVESIDVTETLPTSVNTEINVQSTADELSTIGIGGKSALSEFEVDQILKSANLDLTGLNVDNSNDATEEKAALPEGISSLSITLNGSECWIQIKDKNQKVLMNEVLPANATYHLEGEAPFALHVGNAKSIDKLIFNGSDVEEKIYRPTSRTTVSKFKLEPKEEN